VAEVDNDNDNDQYEDAGGQQNKDNPIENDVGDLHLQITDEDHQEVATEHRLMLEMRLENPSQWKTEERLNQERMVAEQERMAA